MLTADEAREIALITEDKPSPPDEALMLAVTLKSDSLMAVGAVESILKSVEWAAKSKKRSLPSWPIGPYYDLPKARRQRIKDMVINKLSSLGYTATITATPASKGFKGRVFVDTKEVTNLEVTW